MTYHRPTCVAPGCARGADLVENGRAVCAAHAPDATAAGIPFSWRVCPTCARPVRATEPCLDCALTRAERVAESLIRERAR